MSLVEDKLHKPERKGNRNFYKKKGEGTSLRYNGTIKIWEKNFTTLFRGELSENRMNRILSVLNI